MQIDLKKNQELSMMVDMVGFPKPDIHLLRNDKNVTEKVNLRAIPHATQMELVCGNATRSNTGNYQLHLKSDIGEENVFFKLIVTGK